MRMKPIVATILLSACSAPSVAGMYTDDLSRCLVEGTSKADKTVLVQWIVMAISQHPAVTTLNKGSAADIDQSNAATGALFMKLLTETCVEQTKKAVKYEGPAAIQGAFGVLGQSATMELFSDPEVQKVMNGLVAYVDEKKLEALKE